MSRNSAYDDCTDCASIDGKRCLSSIASSKFSSGLEFLGKICRDIPPGQSIERWVTRFQPSSACYASLRMSRGISGISAKRREKAASLPYGRPNEPPGSIPHYAAGHCCSSTLRCCPPRQRQGASAGREPVSEKQPASSGGCQRHRPGKAGLVAGGAPRLRGIANAQNAFGNHRPSLI